MKNLRVLWITAAVFVLDRVTKIYISRTMDLYDSYQVFGNFFRITYVENTGMAFGVQPAHGGLLTGIAVIASLFILYYLFRIKGERPIARISIASILGGAIGNLYDRIVHGSVVDFLDVEFFDIHIASFNFWFINFEGYSLQRWPVFNVADIAITLGMITLLCIILTEKDHHNRERIKD